MSSSLADDKFNRVIDESEYTDKNTVPMVFPPDKDKSHDEENPQDFERYQKMLQNQILTEFKSKNMPDKKKPGDKKD